MSTLYDRLKIGDRVIMELRYGGRSEWCETTVLDLPFDGILTRNRFKGDLTGFRDMDGCHVQIYIPTAELEAKLADYRALLDVRDKVRDRLDSFDLESFTVDQCTRLLAVLGEVT